jgi:acyl-CoA synthetase (AMP-forming)/AMP-acid ligase II
MATEEEIIKYCKGNIAGYSVPSYVRFVRDEEWPRTVTGKIPRIKVKEMIMTRKSQASEEPSKRIPRFGV